MAQWRITLYDKDVDILDFYIIEKNNVDAAIHSACNRMKQSKHLLPAGTQGFIAQEESQILQRQAEIWLEEGKGKPITFTPEQEAAYEEFRNEV